MGSITVSVYAVAYVRALLSQLAEHTLSRLLPCKLCHTNPFIGQLERTKGDSRDNLRPWLFPGHKVLGKEETGKDWMGPKVQGLRNYVRGKDKDNIPSSPPSSFWFLSRNSFEKCELRNIAISSMLGDNFRTKRLSDICHSLTNSTKIGIKLTGQFRSP